MSTQHRSRFQKGTTLIEALISILVMSFGLLGLAGLQVGALGFQQAAWSSHRVAEITGNFAERVRANSKAVVSDYQYTANYATGKAASPTKNNCRTTGACSPSQIAADDIADLLAKAQTSLPQGAIQVSATSANVFVITAMYRDKDSTDVAPTCSASSTGIDWRNCCPAAAQAPAGVKCRRLTVLPWSF